MSDQIGVNRNKFLSVIADNLSAMKRTLESIDSSLQTRNIMLKELQDKQEQENKKHDELVRRLTQKEE